MADNSPGMMGQAIGVNKNLAELVKVMATAFPLHCSTGYFTMSAASSKVISDTNVKSGSIMLPMPVNGPAATLMASAHSLYVSARTAGTSFTVATADGVSAAGTEKFEYILVSLG